jgi:hypothetical protein
VRVEYAAFLARLRAHSMLANKTETVQKTNADGSSVRTNYVILFPGVPELDDERYTAAQETDSTATYRYDVRVVAVDADGLLQLTEAVHAQLIGHVLTLPDRVAERIRLLPGVEEGRVQFDRTARLFYLDETYEFVTRRAS